MPSAHDVSSPTDRPRERLLSDGPRALSDADLLVLVLGTGSAGRSARAAALALLETTDLAGPAWAPADELAALPGFGPARAAAVAAAFELGRRGAWSRQRLAQMPRSTRAPPSKLLVHALVVTWACSPGSPGTVPPPRRPRLP